MMKLTKTQILLLIIFIFGLTLRVMAANNMHISTVEMTYSSIANNIIAGKSLSTVEQSPLYFHLTDLGYKLFGGVSAFSARTTNVIASSMLILVVFLLTQELFRNKRISLTSAFLFALSGFVLTNNYEMDMLCFFFTLLSILFFVRFLRSSRQNLYLSILFLALAVMVKPFVIVILIVSPILIYNYFTLQEIGITDVYLSQKFGIGETSHKGMESGPWGFIWVKLVSTSMIKEIIQLDWLIFFTGLLGMILTFRKNKYAHALIILSLLTYFFYKSGESGGSNHFVFLPLVLSIYAGYALVYLHEKLKNKFKFKYFLPLVVFVSIFIGVTAVQDVVAQRGNSMTLNMIDYVHEEIPDNALVIVDPRIYRGVYAWVFNDKHYLEGTQFADLYNALPEVSGQVVTVPLYYIECGPGTNCGWRTEDFERIYDTGEQISKFFREKSQLIKEVRAIDYIKIYRTETQVPMGVYDMIDRTHQFWFYPVGWKYPEMAVDHYEVEGFDSLVNNFGFLMLYLDMFLSIMTVLFVFYLIFRKSKNIE